MNIRVTIGPQGELLCDEQSRQALSVFAEREVTCELFFRDEDDPVGRIAATQQRDRMVVQLALGCKGAWKDAPADSLNEVQSDDLREQRV